MVFGGGPLGRGRAVPPWVNEAAVICGAVLSMRKASVSDEARARQRGLIGLARRPRPRRTGSPRAGTGAVTVKAARGVRSSPATS